MRESEPPRIVIGPEYFSGVEDFDEWLWLAQLLMDQKILTTMYPTRETGKETISCVVICNDVFSWGSADGEPFSTADLPMLYQMHMADPKYGTELWCIKHRGEMPQPCVLKELQDAGVWNLDESTLKENRDARK